jgi:RNA polymerase sigma factor (sigma-70 family)
MVKNPAQAEDLTQDTFLAVFRGIREFRGHSAFGTWLHQVARNTVLMCFRKKRLKETSLEEFGDRDYRGDRPAMEFGAPDRRIEGLADRMALQNAVAQLSRGFRATLLLHDVHGYQHREVAKLLGCSTGTSKSQLHKARLRVRETLQKCLGGAKNNRVQPNGGSSGHVEAPSASVDDKPASCAERTPQTNEPPCELNSLFQPWCAPLEESASGLEQ